MRHRSTFLFIDLIAMYGDIIELPDGCRMTVEESPGVSLEGDTLKISIERRPASRLNTVHASHAHVPEKGSQG